MLPPCSLLSMTCRFAVPAASHWPSSVQIASDRFKLGQQFPLPRPPISGLHADSAIVTTSRSTSAAPGRSTVAGKEAASPLNIAHAAPSRWRPAASRPPAPSSNGRTRFAGDASGLSCALSRGQSLSLQIDAARGFPRCAAFTEMCSGIMVPVEPPGTSEAYPSDSMTPDCSDVAPDCVRLPPTMRTASASLLPRYIDSRSLCKSALVTCKPMNATKSRMVNLHGGYGHR